MCPGKPVHDVVPLGGYPGAVLVRCRSARAERAPGAGVLVVEFDILCEGSTPPTPAARSAGRADSKIAKTTSPAWTSKRYSSCASNAPSTLMTGAGTCASTTANPVTSWVHLAHKASRADGLAEQNCQIIEAQRKFNTWWPGRPDGAEFMLPLWS